MNCLLFVLLLIGTDIDQQIQANMFQENVSLISVFTNKSSHGVVRTQNYDNSVSTGTIYSASDLHTSSSEKVISYGGSSIIQNTPIAVKKADPTPTATVANIFDGKLEKADNGQVAKYDEYCANCHTAGKTPLPHDAWSAGQWDEHPNLFHPKPKGPTGYEDLYWEEHGAPIGEANCLLAFVIGYGLVNYLRHKKSIMQTRKV